MRYNSIDRENRLLECQAAAARHGGVCLSTYYKDNKTKLKWRCAKGHDWQAIPSNVLRGHWCLICGNEQQGRTKAHSIKVAQKAAAEKGGICLSTEYRNNHIKLRWRCAKGHEWETQASVIISGHWCPKCEKERMGRKYALTIEDMRKIATERGGKCLSSDYLNNRSRLMWRCPKGHEWEAIANSVRRGSWCPVCSGRSPT